MKLFRILLLIGLLAGCSLPPIDTPVPPPGPAPVVKVPSLWVVTIDNFGQRTGSVRKLMTDLPYWASLQQRGHHYRFLDAVADADEVQKKLQDFSSVKPPCFLMFDAATDKPLGAAPLVDKAGVNTAIAQFSDK